MARAKNLVYELYRNYLFRSFFFLRNKTQLMENIGILKKEFEEENSLIVKKEEDIVPKLEANNYTYACQIRYQKDQMTVPWSTDCARFNPSSPARSAYFTNLALLEQKYSGKPFKIIRKSENRNHLAVDISYHGSYKQVNQDDKFINVKMKQPEKNNKQNQAKFCKNYVGLLCSGFARTVLTTKYGSQISNFIKETLAKRKMKFPSLRNQEDSKILDSFRSHTHKMMCGKKARKANKDRDFKIRNTRDLQKLWKILDKDSELTRLKKEVLREVMEYFFEYYADWLSNGMMTFENRNFFIHNKVEIQNKFLYPGIYKPKFNRNLD